MNSRNPWSVALGLEVSIGLSGFSSSAALAGMAQSWKAHNARRTTTKQDLGRENERVALVIMMYKWFHFGGYEKDFGLLSS
jgi:hypothetical protein